ncbi:MAG: rRNA maturation RNase YbeY [Opitutaceae bacterium]|nr:rRNA maturation RNase YbeY [Opitutaceae bacterium]
MTPAERTVVLTNRHPRLRVPADAVARAFRLLEEHADRIRLPAAGRPAGELSVVVLTDPALARIHADFLGDPTTTDVITFAGDPATGSAGEICVSADTAARFVGLPPGARRPARQAAFAAELTLYLVHGWLHLGGYDDLQPARKRRMRAAEQRALAVLRAHGAIPGFRFA